jgi:hypothetical protein
MCSTPTDADSIILGATGFPDTCFGLYFGQSDQPHPDEDDFDSGVVQGRLRTVRSDGADIHGLR